MYQLTKEQKVANLFEQLDAVNKKIENLQIMKTGLEAKLLKLGSSLERSNPVNPLEAAARAANPDFH